MPPRSRLLLVSALLTGLALSACATRPQQSAMASRTVRGDTEDYLLRPINDTNLRKRRIAPVLLAAVDEPYARAGLKDCAYIRAAIGELDAALGPDLDEEGPDRRENLGHTAGRVGLATAKEFLGGIVPVRSVVRELSGARKADARLREAVYAGAIRRGYLKGLATARGCKPPSASPRQVEAGSRKAEG